MPESLVLAGLKSPDGDRTVWVFHIFLVSSAVSKSCKVGEAGKREIG